MRRIKLTILLLIVFVAGYALSFFTQIDNSFTGIALDINKNKTKDLTSINAKEKTKIQTKIQKVFPDLKVEEIAYSPIYELYQVIANSEVFYTSKDGRYLLHGNLLDLTKDQDNLSQTEEVRKSIRLKILSDLSPKDLIIFSPQKVKSVVTIFTDFDCIFCQKFHSNIEQIMALGIEVRYIAFPRQGIGSASYDKTVSIWCADDPRVTMKLAAGGSSIPIKKCDNPVAKQYESGRKLNIQGTPTILFSDGTMLTKYMLPEELAKFALEHQLKKRI